MRKLKDALRLKLEAGQSHQQIADSLEISKGVVTKYVGLAVAAGLDWPAVQAMDEAALERRLLSAAQPAPTYARPDYGRIHQELRRKGVTLMLLWEEYCAQASDEHTPEHPVRALRYSQFCETYRQSTKRGPVQPHRIAAPGPQALGCSCGRLPTSGLTRKFTPYRRLDLRKVRLVGGNRTDHLFKETLQLSYTDSRFPVLDNK